MLGSLLGMVLLAEAQNLITFFVALELLSIPLYVLCGSHRIRGSSLESGLKYLIVGSLGSATLLYGMAFIYGGSGSTDFAAIATGIGTDLADDPLILIGIALCAVGLAFKVSVAPFHQWTPDVYEGAPTPITVVHGGRDEGRRVRRLRPLLHRRPRPLGRPVAAGARRDRGDLDRRRQRRRAHADLAQAACSATPASPRPATSSSASWSRPRPGVERAGLLPRRLHADELRRLRGDRRSASARRPSATTSRRSRASAATARRSPGR